MMKKLLIALLCLPLAFACKDDQKSNSDTTESTEVTQKETAEMEKEAVSEKQSIVKSSTKSELKSSEITPKDLAGEFQRSDDNNDDLNCNCNCISIQMEQNTKLCLDLEENIHIQVKFKQDNKSNLAMYYVSGSGKMEGQDEIPWADFDTNQPLAMLQFTTPNNFELDWKGFMKNGEIAMDYAVLGKKNLEGNYKRK